MSGDARFKAARRRWLQAGAAGAVMLPFGGLSAAANPDGAIGERLASLERRHGGRLGVCVLDTANGQRLVHRADERFPMCSTFKALAAAHVLARVDAGKETLERRIVFPRQALVAYSPVTERFAGSDGMTVAQVCHAAVTVSDNTAGNLLLDSFGGPAGLTAFLRGLGDGVTRLDRRETELNQATPGDPRDTTTPAAMAASLRKLLLGRALSMASRMQLADWMVATTTGGQRLRAGLPRTWRVGDKTGTSDNGVTNDVAIAWPPARPPLILAVYYAEAQGSQEQRNAVIADVGTLAAGWVGQR